MGLVWHSEGDSISSVDVWQVQIRKRSAFTWTYHNYAVDSATIAGATNSLTARESTVAAAFSSGDFNMLTIYIGANNFQGSDSTANDADMAALAGYCSRMRAAGFYIVLATMTPQGSGHAGYPQFNLNRAIYNPQYRALMGVSVHAIADLGADPVMGPDAAADDGTLYNNGDWVHPTTVGKGHIARVFGMVIEPLGAAVTRRLRVVF